MNTAKYSVILCMALLQVGCSYHNPKSQTLIKSMNVPSDLVRLNASSALEQCGKGNVRAVTSVNFSCKNAEPPAL